MHTTTDWYAIKKNLTPFSFKCHPILRNASTIKQTQKKVLNYEMPNMKCLAYIHTADTSKFCCCAVSVLIPTLSCTPHTHTRTDKSKSVYTIFEELWVNESSQQNMEINTIFRSNIVFFHSRRLIKFLFLLLLLLPFPFSNKNWSTSLNGNRHS